MPISGRADVSTARSMTLQIFSAMHLAERAAEDREVLAEDEDLAAVDGAPAGDHAVGVRAAGGRARTCRRGARQRVGLDERARVQQQVEALARGELAAAVLRLGRVRPGGRGGLGVTASQVVDAAGGGRRRGGGLGRAFGAPSSAGSGVTGCSATACSCSSLVSAMLRASLPRTDPTPPPECRCPNVRSGS